MKGNQGQQKRRGVIDFSSFLVVITTADCICFRVWVSNHWNQSHCVRSKYNKSVFLFSFSACVTSCCCLALDVFSSSSSIYVMWFSLSDSLHSLSITIFTCVSLTIVLLFNAVTSFFQTLSFAWVFLHKISNSPFHLLSFIFDLCILYLL